MCKRITAEDITPFPRCDKENAKGFAPRLKTFTLDYLKRSGREKELEEASLFFNKKRQERQGKRQQRKKRLTSEIFRVCGG
jgi:hypothetical protein